MRKELTILTKVTKEVIGNLPGGGTVRYSGMYKPGKGLGFVHIAITKEDRQVLTINHQREGQVGHNFSAGNDFKTMETVVDEALSDTDNLYDEAGSENARPTIENGIITGVSND